MVPSYGQETKDLYSLESSCEFAKFLQAKGDLQEAADEYARILYMDPDDDTVLVRLSSLYRSLGHPQKAQRLFSNYRSRGLHTSYLLEFEHLATLLFQDDTTALLIALEQSQKLAEEEKRRFAVEHAMLRRHWPAAESLLSESPASPWQDPYRDLTQRAQAFQPKKPWLAAAMSVFIPGSGKIYAKNTKEGVTSFLFVAAMGYQSYRAFHKRGSRSAAGWIYGGLGLGFYFGNIYGAQQSAKNYNQRKWQEIYDEVDAIIYRRY